MDGPSAQPVSREHRADADAARSELVSSHAGAGFFCARVAAQRGRPDATALRVLVVGCGEGHEAAFIQRALDASVQAIDMNVVPSPELRARARLSFCRASVQALPFEDGAFDAIFYHPVIEHVDDPRASVAEVARVLARRGLMFIGTPNRNRLLSAVGSYEHTNWESTWSNKLKENWNDWRARLRGRFHNHYGVHAGFTRSELDALLSPWFKSRQWVTREYLTYKYGRSRARIAVRLATSGPLLGVSAPSIYAFCRKGDGD
jgi:SAM-dependent methyltransferase